MTMLHRLVPTIVTGAAFTAASSALALAAPQAQGVYLPQNGLIVCPFESNVPVDQWDLSTSTPGWVGEGYFVWEGPNYFDTPGNGVFDFNFEIDTGGTWRLAIRNRHEDPDPTEENDVWVRVDNGPWIKTFSNGPQSVGNWTWETRFELGHGSYPDASYNLSPGTHRIQFSGRSNGFKMDRFHLYRPGTPGANDPSQPESPRRFGAPSCAAEPNSTGSTADIIALGSPFADSNDVILETSDLPPNTLGYYLASRQSGFVANPANSAGNLCLAGTIGRYAGNVISTGAAGRADFRLNLNQMPLPDGTFATVLGGQTWYFQFWHRDFGSAGATSNFSPGLEVNFE